MDKQYANRIEEVELVFGRAVPVIRAALVSYYRLSDEEAGEAEKDLHVWFHRLSRRGGGGQMPVKALRLSLLSAACQYGRSFQIWKLGGAPSTDARLNSLLLREPEEVASDLAEHLDGDQV
jgi:hypothetical protein